MRESERAEPMWVCRDCLNDSMLKMMGDLNFESHLCAGCETVKEATLTPRRIASFIGKYLPLHFEVDPGLFPGYELTLDALLEQAIGCKSQKVCRAIAENLEDSQAGDEDFYWPGQLYRRRESPFESKEDESAHIVSEWSRVALELIHGRRYFNDRAQRFFESLVEEATGARSDERGGGAAVVTTIPSGTPFYRARRANGLAEARRFADSAASELGAPPKERAANNRMSAAGVPLLYVSKDQETCMAEIRPSIGDMVVVGKFTSTSELKFFDFNVLTHGLQYAPLSFFDSEYKQRDEHRKFVLEYMHDEIARPVRATDIDYVMTQALAEYIRYHKPGEFNGISFRSVQRKSGVNFVLFDKTESAAFSDSNWKPTFDLGIEAHDVSVHVVEGVTYSARATDF